LKQSLTEIFKGIYRELRPRAPIPEIKVEFYPFANINNTIRLRDGNLFIRLSDLLEGAPDNVLRAIAHILLAKIYRKPIEKSYAMRYRRHVASSDLTSKAHLVRQLRGRKRIDTAQGHVYDLEAIFDDLNQKYFWGLLARPEMTWSQSTARNLLGHYDPAHNAIVISRVFDNPRVPKYAIEYLVYHEMLHLKHPVKVRGGRRCIHGPQFIADEKLFPHFEAAKSFLKRL
jgi:predicted metal-dependent hydrolase